MRTSLRWVLLFLIGGVVGTALDHLHVAFGVLSYLGDTPLVQPHWVPVLFGSAGALFVVSYQRFRAPGERGSLSRALISIALFAAAYACSAIFHTHPLRLFAGFLVGFVPLLVRGTTSPWAPHIAPRFALYALLIAIGGTLFESAIIKLGAFGYLHPGPLPVPIWLPGLYLYAAYCAQQVELAFYVESPSAEMSPLVQSKGSLDKV